MSTLFATTGHIWLIVLPMSDEDRGHRIERARQTYDEATAAYEAAREQLFAEILAGLAEGMGPSAAARHSRFTREYVARIRDGKVKTSQKDT